MNPDFVDLLQAFAAADVRFLIVSAYALAHHGRPRATGDLDVWVDPTPANAVRIMRGLAAFGAPVHDVQEEDCARPGGRRISATWKASKRRMIVRCREPHRLLPHGEVYHARGCGPHPSESYGVTIQTTGAGLKLGPPGPLFDSRAVDTASHFPGSVFSHAVSADRQRFLVARSGVATAANTDPAQLPLNVLMNWTTLLNSR